MHHEITLLCPHVYCINSIYALFNRSEILEQKVKKETLEYFDGFYNNIKDTIKWQGEFSYPFDSRGTGNVVIKVL
jgi:hypothetical protein